RVEQGRLAGAGRGDDQRPLSVADRRDEIDRASSELGSALRGTAGLHEQLSFGVGRRQRIELRPLGGELRVGIVDRAHFHDGRSPALVDADGRVDQIGAPEGELPHQVGRHVRIARFGEVAVRGPAHEAGIARGVEPPAHLARGDDLNRLLRSTAAAAATSAATRTLLMVASRSTATAPAAMSSTAAIAAIVEIVAAAATILPTIGAAIRTPIAIWRILRLLIAATRRTWCAVLVARWRRTSLVHRRRVARAGVVRAARATVALRGRNRRSRLRRRG